jgi:hypothetical protein
VSTKDLDAESIIAAFNHHSVQFVVIGGFASQLHGAPVPPTEDIDFTPATSEDNLERLDRALTALRARIRTSEEPDGLAFEHNAKTLGERRMLNLTCPHGDFDISFVPSGTEGYGDLVRRDSRSGSGRPPSMSPRLSTSSAASEQPDVQRTSGHSPSSSATPAARASTSPEAPTCHLIRTGRTAPQ